MADEESKPTTAIAGFSTNSRASVTFAPEQAERVNRAAERAGETVMSFIRAATLDRAERVLAEDA